MAEVAGRDSSGTMEAGSKPEPSTGKATAAQQTGDGGGRADTADSEQDDEDDVFEVESIIDSKIEGGEVLYRVRWKGYDADGDTWEPEAHLDDCREVLLEFRRQQAEAKQKLAKKETPKLSLSDVFQADSDSEPQSDIKDASPHKRKKKSSNEEDDNTLDDLRKKKNKSVKSKEKSKESEPLESPESKPKKRMSEGKEDLTSKKQKKDDFKESKKLKKEETKDTKAKGKEEHKDKKHKRERDKSLESEQPSPAHEVPSESIPETTDMSVDVVLDEKIRPTQEVEDKSQEAVPDLLEEPLGELQAMDDESDDVKIKKKKKKHKKLKSDKGDESKTIASDDLQSERKSLHKKQKSVEKVREPSVEKLPAPVQKTSKLSSEEKIRKSVDSVAENETKKPDLVKDKTKKKHDSEKEVKKDSKVIKNSKEHKSTPFGFTISPEEKNEITECARKKEDPLDCRLSEDFKPKEPKTAFKERRNTRDETDSWSYTASEGDQEVVDSVCHLQENSAALDSKSQILGLGMDLQLEWMTLEDFQKHLDGSDELLPTETISNNALKDAVKNGDYLTVKFALNSSEEYNLDQEDSSGMTLAMMAAAAGQDDLLRLLIKKGAKVNAKQKNGTTALIHAAEKNYLTTVALLLEAGAYVNVQQASGETALMKACKRGNSDIARLLIEHGADCNIQSKYQANALQFAKQSNDVLLYKLLESHLETLTRVVEDAIRDYFEMRLAILEPVFPIACHRLCEGPDFSLDFPYKPPYLIPEGSGILLFVFHANFFGKEVVVRLCGPCSVQAVVLNDKFQLPVFLDAHFIYSFSPVNGLNKLFIRLSEVPTAKVKLLICAYRVQLK
ncbi:M-phase phosphoprotein 8 [Spea bombifrons]|uniref:M-phase phosphoprotein 8 n=1 Tax=Spea bombifrons TaxID=233779 RepID=UPI002349CEEC|nr:M-phase phosphoprotein 8 [Spea bombifrons]